MERVKVALSDPKFWKLEHFCFTWDLKSGCIISTVIGFTVMMSAMLATTGLYQHLYQNFDPEFYGNVTLQQNVHYGLVYTYLIIGLVSFAIAFIGTFVQHYILAIVGTCMVGFTFLYWIALLIPSFSENTYGFVCIKSRCPDMHWFVDSRWRDFRYALAELDCRLRQRIGTALQPMKPPIKDYPRLFTKYNVYTVPHISKIYEKWYLDQNWKDGVKKKKKREVPAVTSDLIKLYETKIINKNVTLKETVNIPQKKRKKLNRRKRKKLKRKFRSRRADRKFIDDGEEDDTGDLVGRIDSDIEQVGDDTDYYEEEEKGERRPMGPYIPLHKLAPPVEPIFEAASIFLAIVWGAFMTNTFFVLLFYTFILYEEEMAKEEEGEEEMEEEEEAV